MLILYGATVVMGLVALSTVFLKDVRAFLVLALLAVGMFVAFRKMGYLEYLAVDKIAGYFYDLGDLMGVTSQRRTFLDRQIDINGAPDYEALWYHTKSALELLKIDRAEIRVNGQVWCMEADRGRETLEGKGREEGVREGIVREAAAWDGVDERKTNLGRGARKRDLRTCQSCDMVSSATAVLERPVEQPLNRGRRLVLSLPLANGDGKKTYGILYLEKDVVRDPLAPFTLRRVEHLRRSLTATLKRLDHQNRG